MFPRLSLVAHVLEGWAALWSMKLFGWTPGGVKTWPGGRIRKLGGSFGGGFLKKSQWWILVLWIWLM